MAHYRIWYMKPEWFRNGICHQKPVLNELKKTHTFLREISAVDLDDVYYQSQSEIWSPNGEARALLEKKGLGHTSMSVGDVIELLGHFWIVAGVGFEELT